METQRFDELARSVAEGETSRRSVLQRVGGGGLAALLAALGIGEFGVEDAEARKGRKPRKKRKPRRKRRRRRGGGGPGTPQSPPGSFFEINNNIDVDLIGSTCAGTGSAGCGGDDSGLTCVGLICLPIGGNDGVTCTDGDDCDSGRCVAAVCAPCPLVSICEENTVCCVVEADCVEGLCALQED